MSYEFFLSRRAPQFFSTLFFVLAGMLFWATAWAAPDAAIPVAPLAARISPSGGLLEVEQQAPTAGGENANQLRIVLPAGAENFQVSVPGHTVVRWSLAPQALDPNGGLGRLRAEKQHALMTLCGKLDAVKAQMGLWEAGTPNGSFQDMVQREKRLAEVMPALSYAKADLERRVALLRQELQHLPASPELGQVVLVTLQKPVAAASALVRYSYTLHDCGWRPVYVFDAHPDKDKGDATDVRFMAEVWQFSGMDWNNARLTLVSGGEGPREPAPLPRWIIDSQAPPVVQPLVKAAPRMLAAVAEDSLPEAAAAAPVVAETGGVYALWTLTERGLPEGRARLLVTEDMWKAPLQWLARPSEGESRVWLMARYALPTEKVWPAGSAEFRVDGQNVGAGSFRPRGNEATLYFGVDPRVQITATADARQRGEKGIIAKSRTWSWAWTYTVRNARQRAVTVRLERPMPMLADKDVTVTYNDKPQAQQNVQEHMLFWNVDVPAGGKAEVRHSLTVASPVEMQLNPDAP